MEEDYREYLSEKSWDFMEYWLQFSKTKYGFYFSLTGLRFVDIQTLPFCNIYSDIHQRGI
jgi:hypothetical protein